jgi:hypothetical protein
VTGGGSMVERVNHNGDKGGGMMGQARNHGSIHFGQEGGLLFPIYNL